MRSDRVAPSDSPTHRWPSRNRLMIGRSVDGVMWLLIAACAAVVVSVVAGWEITPRLVAAQALLPVVGGLAVVAAAIGALRRRRAVLAVGAAVALWAIGLVAPAALSHTPPSWAATASTLTVYGANLRRTNTTPAAAFAAASASDADVVVLVEYADAFEPSLRASGLLARYRTVVRDDAFDKSLLLTRLPVVDTGVVTEAGLDLPTATVLVTSTGGTTPVLIAGVHTQSPTHFADLDRWVRQVPGIARVLDHYPNAVAIGDFNSSLWNPPLRQLLDWGFTDAHDATGNGLARTWGPSPTGTTASMPILGIDHAISRGPDIEPLDVVEGDIPGSDHRSIKVTYAVR